VKTGKGSFKLCSWREIVLAEPIGTKTPMVNWPSCDIEIKLSYKIKLDSIVVEELLVLNVEGCFVFFLILLKKLDLWGQDRPHSIVL